MSVDTHHVLKTMIGHNARFDEVEEYIESLPLDPDDRSALWLLAWTQATNPAIRARIASESRAGRPV